MWMCITTIAADARCGNDKGAEIAPKRRKLRYNGLVLTISKAMANYFDAIERHLAHAESTYEDDETYIHLLDSVIREANSRRMRASHRMFGAQFTPAAEVVETGDEATRQFQRRKGPDQGRLYRPCRRV